MFSTVKLLDTLREALLPEASRFWVWNSHTFPWPFLGFVSFSFLVKKGNWHQYILYLLHGLMLSHVNVCFCRIFVQQGLMNLEISMWYQDRGCGMCRAKLGRVDQVKTDWVSNKNREQKKRGGKQSTSTPSFSGVYKKQKTPWVGLAPTTSVALRKGPLLHIFFSTTLPRKDLHPG